MMREREREMEIDRGEGVESLRGETIESGDQCDDSGGDEPVEKEGREDQSLIQRGGDGEGRKRD